jgi:hypothetical protein
MRTAFVFIVFFNTIIGFSQDLVAGFYEIDDTFNGILLKKENSSTEFFIKLPAILSMREVVRVRSEMLGTDDTYSITFKLSEKGTQTITKFSQEQVPTRVALVLDNKIMHSVHMLMGITGGMFSMNGLDKKEAKALEKKLRKWKANPLSDHLLYKRKDFLIYQNKAMYNGTELYNTQTDQNLFEEQEDVYKSKCKSKYASYYNPLSLVGSFYSYESFESIEKRCIKMGTSLGVQTISIETGEPISLLSLFEEEDVVQAFKKDAWVREMIENYQIDIEEIKNFQDILNFPKDKLGTNIQYSPSSFCLEDFESGIARIRFVGRGYVGNNNYWHASMVFYLPVKHEMLQLFTQSQNFYLGSYPNGVLNN